MVRTSREYAYRSGDDGKSFPGQSEHHACAQLLTSFGGIMRKGPLVGDFRFGEVSRNPIAKVLLHFVSYVQRIRNLIGTVLDG